MIPYSMQHPQIPLRGAVYHRPVSLQLNKPRWQCEYVVECVNSSLHTSFVVMGRILIPPLSINPPSSAQTEVIGSFLW